VALRGYDALREAAVARDADVRQASRRLRAGIARGLPAARLDRLRADADAARAALDAAQVPLAAAEDAVTRAVLQGRHHLVDDAETAERAYRAASRSDEATAARRGADAAWSLAWRGAGSGPLEPAAPTLVRLLRRGGRQPAWVNLWRRTDYLGFPVVSYSVNPVDRGADEVDRGAYLFTVASHSTYFRSWAYHLALDTVLGRLDTPVLGTGAEPARRVGAGVG
ncbi:hypothetical protein IF650_13830, partial [Cellulosimicrobium terreum]|nr:hypothetical protein [Cellulosimicrobium terreum]